AVKTIMIWTGATERTVKNWLSGAHGPHGDYLLILLGKSDAVLDALVGTLTAERLAELTLRLTRRSLYDHQLPWGSVPHIDATSATKSPAMAGAALTGTLGGGPVDPSPDPNRDPDSLNGYADLNNRQIWFLCQLRSGRPLRGRDLGRQHN